MGLGVDRLVAVVVTSASKKKDIREAELPKSNAWSSLNGHIRRRKPIDAGECFRANRSDIAAV